MLPAKWIDELFKRFEGMYGAQFVAKWDGLDVANIKRVWGQDLDGISGETIADALVACKENCKFPPSSAEFFQLCKAVRRPPAQEKYMLPHHKNYSPEVAKANLEKMHKMLNGSKLLGSNHD